MFPDKEKKNRKIQQTSLMGRQRTVPLDTSLSAGQPARHRLLLIEDHEGLAEATAEFIRGEGLEVRVAYCGRDGLAVVPTFQPEIIICDMRLPDMTGLEVAQTLRSSLSPKKPVIAISSAMRDADLVDLERSAADTGVSLFLSKPITLENLDTLLSALNTLRQAASKTTS